MFVLYQIGRVKFHFELYFCSVTLYSEAGHTLLPQGHTSTGQRISQVKPCQIITWLRLKVTHRSTAMAAANFRKVVCIVKPVPNKSDTALILFQCVM